MVVQRTKFGNLAYRQVQNSFKNLQDRDLLQAEIEERPLLASLPRPGNILEWLTEPGFLFSAEAGVQPFSSQYELLRDFYELLCPNCNDLEEVESRRGTEPTENLSQFAGEVYFRFDECPVCGMHRSEATKDGYFHGYNELVGAAGSRSGKTALVGWIATYLGVEVLTLHQPWRRYRLLPNETIEIVFVAASRAQAADTIWEKFKNFFEESPWYKKAVKTLKGVEDDPSNPFRRGDLYRGLPPDSRIEFRSQRVRFLSMASNSGSMSGRSRIGSFCDEIAKLDQTDSKRSADEVYGTLKQGLMDIRMLVADERERGDYILPDALQVSISSPLFPDDKVMLLLEEARTSGKMFGFHRATWQMNPRYTYEKLEKEFPNDPYRLRRDFGAEPADERLAFLPELVSRGITTNSPILYARDRFFEDCHPVTGEIRRYVSLEIVNCITDKVTPRVLVADAGWRHDSYGICIGHSVFLDGAMLYVYDAVLEIRPVEQRQTMPPHEVHFTAAEEVIREFAKKLNLVTISFDRWQQVQTIQNLFGAGLSTEQRNVNAQDYTNFRLDLGQDHVQLLPPESEAAAPTGRGMPQAKALWELKAMKEIGGKFIKGDRASDDVCQCVVGVHHHLRELAFPVAAVKQGVANDRPGFGRAVSFRRY